MYWSDLQGKVIDTELGMDCTRCYHGAAQLGRLTLPTAGISVILQEPSDYPPSRIALIVCNIVKGRGCTVALTIVATINALMAAGFRRESKRYLCREGWCSPNAGKSIVSMEECAKSAHFAYGPVYGRSTKHTYVAN